METPGTANPLCAGSIPASASSFIDFVLNSVHNLFMYTDPRGGHNQKKFNKNFFKVWSPEMAYVLGYIYSDGAIEDVRKSSRTCYLAITSVDFDILYKIRRSLSSNHELYIKKKNINVFPGGRKYLCKKAYILRIGSKSLYDDLVSLGLTPRKSLTLNFPSIPEYFLSYFIRGYFDGDGCVMVSTGKDRRIPSITTVFTCGSLSFLERLNHLLHKFTKSRYRNLTRGDHAYQLSYRKYDSLKVLDFIYKGLNNAPFLERKYNKYQSYLETL